MHIKIIKPDGLFFEGESDFVEFPSVDGRMGVYKNHIPLTTILGSGEMLLHMGEEVQKAKISGGFIEVQKDYINALVEEAEWI